MRTCEFVCGQEGTLPQIEKNIHKKNMVTCRVAAQLRIPNKIEETHFVVECESNGMVGCVGPCASPADGVLSLGEPPHRALKVHRLPQLGRHVPCIAHTYNMAWRF